MSSATMSTTKKRKSTDGSTVTAASKKVKTSKPTDQPAPLKSALKKVKVDVAAPSKPASKDAQPSKKTTSTGATKKANPTCKPSDKPPPAKKLTAEQTADLLAGFSSSDEDSASETETGIALTSIPSAPTTGLIQKRIQQAIAAQPDPEVTPGVIYVGRIPHGFYEAQMRAYFSQFGEIQHLRLARNKKTGRSQHYAFVQFSSAAVAEIVAKTMDKYLLFGHILQVRRVREEHVKDNMFDGADRRPKKPAPRNRMEGSALRRGATRDVWEKRTEKENAKRKAKGEKLREMGYEFDMPVVKAVAEVPVKAKESEVVLAVEDTNESGGEGLVEVQVPTALDDAETVAEVQPEATEAVVVEETKAKKRAASGKMQTKKTVKKTKT